MDSYVLGPAWRSGFRERTLPVAVSFSVPEHVNGPPNPFILSNLELNPPEVLLTKKKLQTHEATVQGRQQKPAVPDATVTRRSKQPYEPTDAQLLIMANLIRSAHPETHSLVSQANIKEFLEWLRIEMDWKVSDSRVKRLLLTRARFVSMGQIPVGAIKEAYLEATIALPSHKIKEVKQHEAPWTEEQKNEHKKAEKLVLKRLVPPKQTSQEMLRLRLAFEQKEGMVVEMVFHENPKHPSYMCLRFTHMYKYESRAKEQPSHKTHVDFTYRNTRPRGHLPNPDVDTYEPSERIIDVSDKRFMPFLAKLFPHLARDDKNYWNKLFHYGDPLTLLQFRQNELPMTSDVFTTRVDVPPSYNNLRIIMRHAPIICVLVRGKLVDEIADSIFKRFRELARFDSL